MRLLNNMKPLIDFYTAEWLSIKSTTVMQQLREHITTPVDVCKQGMDQKMFNRKSIARKITHARSWNLQAKLTEERLKG